MLKLQDRDLLRDLLGKKIRRLRKHSNLTQDQLALQIGLNRSTLCRIERGVRVATFDELVCIAEEFGMSASELLIGVELMRYRSERIITYQIDYYRQRKSLHL